MTTTARERAERIASQPYSRIIPEDRNLFDHLRDFAEREITAACAAEREAAAQRIESNCVKQHSIVGDDPNECCTCAEAAALAREGHDG